MKNNDGSDILNYISSLIEKKEIQIALKLLDEFKFTSETLNYCYFLKVLCYINQEVPNYHKALEFCEKINDEFKNETLEYIKYVCKFETLQYEDIVKYHLSNCQKFDEFDENMKMMIVISYEKLNLIKTARKLYKDIIRIHPYNLNALNNLSILEMVNDNNSEALWKLKSYHDLSDEINNIEIAANYALCLIKNDRISEGFNLYEKIIKMNKGCNEEIIQKIKQKILL